MRYKINLIKIEIKFFLGFNDGTPLQILTKLQHTDRRHLQTKGAQQPTDNSVLMLVVDSVIGLPFSLGLDVAIKSMFKKWND